MDSSTQLGALISEHKITARGIFKVIVLMLFGLAVGGGLLGLGIFGGDDNIPGRIIMSILGLLFLLVPGLGAYGLLRGRGNAIRIHENGIAIRRGGTDTALLWDDIEMYDDGLFLILGTKDEQSFEFGMDGLRAGSEIIAKLREEIVVKRAVPRMKATLLEGKAGSFESDDDEPAAPPAEGVIDVTGFRIDVDGIAPLDSDELTPWNEVTACQVEEMTLGSGRQTRVVTYVVITSKTKKLRAMMNTTCNRDACVAMCREMMPR